MFNIFLLFEKGSHISPWVLCVRLTVSDVIMMAAVAQVYQPEGQWLIPRPFHFACRSIRGHDTEPRVTPDVSIGVQVCAQMLESAQA